MEDSDRHYVITDPTSCTLYSFDKYGWDKIKKDGNKTLNKNIHGICTLTINTEIVLRDGEVIPPPPIYSGKDYAFHEVSALVDPANRNDSNSWKYGFIYSTFKGKATMDLYNRIASEKKQKMKMGATDRDIVKKVCKPTSRFPTDLGSFEKQIDDPGLSSNLLSVLRRMIDNYEITEIYVTSILGGDRATHAAKKAIDIATITLPGGTIEYGTAGYNKLKGKRDEITNWLASLHEVYQIWDHYELLTSGKKEADNDWQGLIKKYGDGIKDSAKAGEDVLKKYLLTWAEAEDKKSGKEKTDKESETFKINEFSEKKITLIKNKVNHRHHLHLSTKN